MDTPTSTREPPATILQAAVFPNLELAAPEDLYVRLNDRAFAELRSRTVRFETGGILSSDTFFSGFTVGAWKRRASVASLDLRLEGEGEFVVRLGLHRLGQVSAWLDERRITLSGDAAVDWPIAAWPWLSDGLLFFHVRALAAGVVRGAAFVTRDAPVHDVRLGLVITHFNRQAQVLPAIARIRRALLDRPDLQGRLTLTVVDNSRNLALEPHAAVEHLPNRNLGGTGGFVRGLLSLIDGGRHTHALFMDDDASCETESIARTFALLRYAKEPRLAVAGALLREVAPWELLEKGARFEGMVRPLHAGLDVRRVDDLLVAERALARPDYGAWWFFAFPIAEVRQFPFPFFVRGDDIFFGLGNGFEIATLNGVACLGEDFSAKHGPVTAYLDARYHLVHALLAPRHSAKGIFWVGSRLFVKALTSYQYTSARAVTLAMRHVLAGPEFFREHLDMQAVRAEIGTWSPSEKLVPIDRSALPVKGARRHRESAARRLVRLLTLQGFLLPGFLIRDRMTVQDKGFHGRASAVFRYRKVLYEHAQSGTGFVAEFDRPRFFAALSEFLRVWAALFSRLEPLRRAYQRGAREMTTIEFWRSVYAQPAATPAVPARPPAQGDGEAQTDATVQIAPTPPSELAPTGRAAPTEVAAGAVDSP